MLQLDPPIPMLTPKGMALAHFVIDYGMEFDLHWTVFLESNGECWTFNNRDVRACKNFTLGRLNVEPPDQLGRAGNSKRAAKPRNRRSRLNGAHDTASSG